MGTRPTLLSRLIGIYIKAIVDLPRLTTGYRRLTNTLGAIAVLLGIALLIPFMMWSRKALGLPMESGSLDGLRLQFIGWVLAILLAIPVCFLSCGMLVSGTLAIILKAMGKISREEAIAYTFLSRYPASWFRRDLPE